MPHPDWKWLIIGVVLALFVWPFVAGLIGSKSSKAPAAPVNS